MYEYKLLQCNTVHSTLYNVVYSTHVCRPIYEVFYVLLFSLDRLCLATPCLVRSLNWVISSLAVSYSVSIFIKSMYWTKNLKMEEKASISAALWFALVPQRVSLNAPKVCVLLRRTFDAVLIEGTRHLTFLKRSANLFSAGTAAWPVT